MVLHPPAVPPDPLNIHCDGLLHRVSADLIFIERRLIPDSKWRESAAEQSYRFSGVFREYEPELTKLLENPRLVIAGEPGAGKSAVTRYVVRRLASACSAKDVPVFFQLRGYSGDLAKDLAQETARDILDSDTLRRRYIFDGLDEVSQDKAADAIKEINDLLAKDTKCAIILTSRQAFYADHSSELSPNLSAYHLLDFDEDDVRDFAAKSGLDPQQYIDDVREALLAEEVRNPFNAFITVNRLKNGGKLSLRRSENVDWAIQQMFATRPNVQTMRQNRAAELLGVGMETYSRNELTIAEATKVLEVGLGEDLDSARNVLNELTSSILIRTPNGITFQLRSYGELLAAKELRNATIDRVMQLAFLDYDVPNPSWKNAISFLAEINPSVRKFFVVRYPDWMLEASPAAFSEEERTAIADNIITKLASDGQFLTAHPTIRARRLYRFVTPQTQDRLIRDLDSKRPEVQANALVILGMAGRKEAVEIAVPIALDVKRNDPVRYAALVCLMNGGSADHVAKIVPILDRNDRYYETLVECAAMLVPAKEFSTVLPFILGTETILSAVFGRVRDLREKDAVVSLLEYLEANPQTLDNYRADGYLSPTVYAVKDCWGGEIGGLVTRVFIAMETTGVMGNGRLTKDLIKAVEAAGGQEAVCRGLIEHFLATDTRPIVNLRIMADWMTLPLADLLIERGGISLIQRLSQFLQNGEVRERLRDHSNNWIPHQDEGAQEARAQQQQREEEAAHCLATRQEKIRTGNFEEVVKACFQLEAGTWPEIDENRQKWLSQHVNEWFGATDLIEGITRNEGGTSWTQPSWLEIILDILERYNLEITPDVKLIHTLRGWPFPEVSNYFRKHSLSEAAKEQVLAQMKDLTVHPEILGNTLKFIEDTKLEWPTRTADLIAVVMTTDPKIDRRPRWTAAHILIERTVDTATLKQMLACGHVEIEEMAFDALVERQDQETIRKELGRLRKDMNALRAADVGPPNDSPISWIFHIRADWAWDDLKAVRKLALEQQLAYASYTITRAMYKVKPADLPALIRAQLQFAPSEWHSREMSMAVEFENQHLFDAAKRLTFEDVLNRLKQNTSLIALRVWLEGSTDAPVFKKLFEEFGDPQLAENVDFVNGWPHLRSRAPHQYLAGGREAVVVMDGDCGRKLAKASRPYTDEAKYGFAHFRGYRITLYVLKRYGIENYFTQAALEQATGRNLSALMPVPETIKITKVLSEQKYPRLHRLLRAISPRLAFFSDKRSFYRKELNEEVARHLTMRDVENTDLGEIIKEIVAKAAKNRTIQ